MPGAGPPEFLSPNSNYVLLPAKGWPAPELTAPVSPILLMLGAGPGNAGGESKCIHGTKIDESFSSGLGWPGRRLKNGDATSGPFCLPRPGDGPGQGYDGPCHQREALPGPGLGDGRGGEKTQVSPKPIGRLPGRWMARGGLRSWMLPKDPVTAWAKKWPGAR